MTEEVKKRTFTLQGYNLNSTSSIVDLEKQPEDRKIELTEDEMFRIYSGYRPRDMELEDFKIISNILKKEMKRYLKGNLVHISKVSDQLWEKYNEGLEIKKVQKGVTYVKKK